MKKDIPSWIRDAADVMIPRVCAVCGCRLLIREKHICLSCLADMPLTRFWLMSHNPMADRFNEVIQKSLVKSDCPPGPREHYAYAAALFIYREDGEYRRITHHLKYHGDLSAGRHFGLMLGKRLASSDLFRDVDVVVPVPLHWMRRWKRGYNQAEIIASAVAQALGSRTDTDILVRCRRTRTQTRLGVEEKAANVAGAFRVRPDRKKDELPAHILLIDDVFTTGSTLGACFVALRSVFPPSVRISVATLGFVGGT